VPGSDERFIAPVVYCWELSVPVVIMLLYMQAPIQRFAHLIGRKIEIRRSSG